MDIAEHNVKGINIKVRTIRPENQPMSYVTDLTLILDEDKEQVITLFSDEKIKISFGE